MTPANSHAAFIAFAAQRGVTLARSTPRSGIGQMVSFYQVIRADGCTGPDGEMLLLQWGPHDWGAGPSFELSITRQFIEQRARGDDALSQLRLTYRFQPSPALRALSDGELWCHEPAGAIPFHELALSTVASPKLVDAAAAEVELTYSLV
ncbi:hypothetical protein M8A51_03950 [Schlegelella sp. S2-27]|uniref:Uncharacterized protein n=1 Tax=Caldimonas mangrovi TaxID=2944811 RepID=A0ABT0YIY2_9BURK|nr:hypothetical protein [Caldimonas mangrovi]MCM5678684.1 hypothetical protein [Caldimonas mangrovi]